MIRRMLVLLTIGIAALGLMATSPDQATASHSWSTYHWGRTSNPFTLKLGDNLSADWKPRLVINSGDWTTSSVLDTTIVAGNTNPKRCGATSGQVEVCNANYGRNGWLGLVPHHSGSAGQRSAG